MKWYKPRDALNQMESQSKALATIAILALGIALVAIFIATGKGRNDTGD